MCLLLLLLMLYNWCVNLKVFHSSAYISKFLLVLERDFLQIKGIMIELRTLTHCGKQKYEIAVSECVKL